MPGPADDPGLLPNHRSPSRIDAKPGRNDDSPGDAATAIQNHMQVIVFRRKIVVKAAPS
jgi:hypothetical protein